MQTIGENMKAVQESGKRKRAIARGVIAEGTGKVRVNNVIIDKFMNPFVQAKMQEPLVLAGDVAQKVDINVTVAGGGPSSQAEAVRLVIAKSLVSFTKNKKLKDLFLEYDRNMLVADVRRKEVKKPNRHGKARAKRQKSYR